MIKYEACDKHQLNSSSKCCFILSFIPNKLTLIRVKLWVKLTGNMKSQNNLIFKILFWPKFPLFDSFTWQTEVWKHPSRFLWNYYNSVQDFMAIFQRRICGPIKHLWWRLSPLTIFEKKGLKSLISFLKFGQREGSWKNCSDIGRLVEREGSLWKGEFQIVSLVFLNKSMFSLLLEYFFLSGKYPHLL